MLRSHGWKLVLMSLMFVLGGCASNPDAPPAVQTVNTPNEENIDPTAVHLHDVAGRLLLFAAKNNRLPATLDDLEMLPGDGGKPSSLDPATGQAFVYSPNAIKPRSLPGRVIVYQAVTKQGGSRWALLFNDHLRETRVQRVADSVLLRPLE